MTAVRRSSRRWMRPSVRVLPSSMSHGTRSLYVRGCRCDDCTDAEAEYSREYRRARERNYPRPPTWWERWAREAAQL